MNLNELNSPEAARIKADAEEWKDAGRVYRCAAYTISNDELKMLDESFIWDRLEEAITLDAKSQNAKIIRKDRSVSAGVKSKTYSITWWGNVIGSYLDKEAAE